LAVNEAAAIEFRCRGNPQGRKIATNNFGIREMSIYYLRAGAHSPSVIAPTLILIGEADDSRPA
jgi:hypothetical protein